MVCYALRSTAVIGKHYFDISYYRYPQHTVISSEREYGGREIQLIKNDGKQGIIPGWLFQTKNHKQAKGSSDAS